ncbi:MAG: thiol-disulfide oxidoreductase DCC family protein [Solirubrobacteraceae bacterium]
MIILFDGVCNFCNHTVNLIIRFDKKDVFKFAALQSNFGQSFLKENNLNSSNFDSIILIEKEQIYYKSDAFFKIISLLEFPFYLFGVFKILPTFFLNKLYNFIAKNRYLIFGKKDSCVIPTKKIKDKFLI